MKNDITLTGLKQKIQTFFDKLRKYNLVLFLALVLILYGTVLFKIHTLRNTEPSDESVAEQVKAANVPHIDESVIKKLESLHDNSVNVQSLFDSARSNPFKE